uniref:Polyprotein n=1 Tax=Bemisia tabaci pesti-like virus 1 TaxID=2840076 RepID=A0A8E8FTL6_9FLAV|nr:polyprotein [Bemisia tabaci pesti-like virus 1]
MILIENLSTGPEAKPAPAKAVVAKTTLKKGVKTVGNSGLAGEVRVIGLEANIVHKNNGSNGAEIGRYDRSIKALNDWVVKYPNQFRNLGSNKYVAECILSRSRGIRIVDAINVNKFFFNVEHTQLLQKRQIAREKREAKRQEAKRLKELKADFTARRCVIDKWHRKVLSTGVESVVETRQYYAAKAACLSLYEAKTKDSSFSSKEKENIILRHQHMAADHIKKHQQHFDEWVHLSIKGYRLDEGVVRRDLNGTYHKNKLNREAAFYRMDCRTAQREMKTSCSLKDARKELAKTVARPPTPKKTQAKPAPKKISQEEEIRKALAWYKKLPSLPKTVSSETSKIKGEANFSLALRRPAPQKEAETPVSTSKIIKTYTQVYNECRASYAKVVRSPAVLKRKNLIPSLTKPAQQWNGEFSRIPLEEGWRENAAGVYYQHGKNKCYVRHTVKVETEKGDIDTNMIEDRRVQIGEKLRLGNKNGPQVEVVDEAFANINKEGTGVAILPFFRYGGCLISGTPIFDGQGKLVSVVTSSLRGFYFVQGINDPVYEGMQLDGMRWHSKEEEEPWMPAGPDDPPFYCLSNCRRPEYNLVHNQKFRIKRMWVEFLETPLREQMRDAFDALLINGREDEAHEIFNYDDCRMFTDYRCNHFGSVGIFECNTRTPLNIEDELEYPHFWQAMMLAEWCHLDDRDFCILHQKPTLGKGICTSLKAEPVSVGDMIHPYDQKEIAFEIMAKIPVQRGDRQVVMPVINVRDWKAKGVPLYNTQNDFVGIVGDERVGECVTLFSPRNQLKWSGMIMYSLLLLLFLPICFASQCQQLMGSTWKCGDNYFFNNHTDHALLTEDDQCENLDSDACMQQRYLLFTKPHWIKHGQANWWTQSVINQNRHLIAKGEAAWIDYDRSFMWFQRNDEPEQVYTNSSSLNYKHYYMVLATAICAMFRQKTALLVLVSAMCFTYINAETLLCESAIVEMHGPLRRVVIFKDTAHKQHGCVRGESHPPNAGCPIDDSICKKLVHSVRKTCDYNKEYLEIHIRHNHVQYSTCISHDEAFFTNNDEGEVILEYMNEKEHHRARRSSKLSDYIAETPHYKLYTKVSEFKIEDTYKSLIHLYQDYQVFFVLIIVYLLYRLVNNVIISLILAILLVGCIPTEATCSNTLINTIEGKGEHSDDRQVNLTQGEIVISVGLCISYNSGGNHTTIRFDKIEEISSSIVEYYVVDDFEMRDFCDYKCWGGSFSKNLTQWLEEISRHTNNITDIEYDEDKIGFGRATCIGEAYLTSACAVDWEDKDVCEVVVNTLLAYQIVYTKTTNGITTLGVIRLYTSGSSNEIDVLSISAPSEKKEAKILRCDSGKNQYRLNSDFSLPTNIIVYQENKVMDKALFTQETTRSIINTIDPCDQACTTNLKGIRHTLPQILLRDIYDSEKVKQIVAKISATTTFKEIEECEGLVMETAIASPPTISGKTTVVAKAKTVKKTCEAKITVKDSSICSAIDSRVLVPSEDIEFAFKLICKKQGELEVAIGGSSLRVKIPEFSYFGYARKLAEPVYSKFMDLKSVSFNPSFAGMSGLLNKLYMMIPQVVIIVILFYISPLSAALVTFVLMWYNASATMISDEQIILAKHGGVYNFVTFILSIMYIIKHVFSFKAALLFVFVNPCTQTVIFMSHIVLSDWLWSRVHMMRRNNCVRTEAYRHYVALLKTIGNSRLYILYLSIYFIFQRDVYIFVILLLVYFVVNMYRISWHGNRVIISLHCIFQNTFDNTFDVIASHDHVFEDIIETPQACNASTQYDASDLLYPERVRIPKVCYKHNGMSGTFDRDFRYINETDLAKGITYCGIFPADYNRDNIVKNVIYSRKSEVNKKLKMAVAVAANPNNEATDKAQKLLYSLLEDEKKPIIEAELQYSIAEKIFAMYGLGHYFNENIHLSDDMPMVFQIKTDTLDTNIGFAFKYMRTIYTSYHVTEGRRLIVPDRTEHGVVVKKCLKASVKNSQLDYVSYGAVDQMRKPIADEWAFVVNPVSQQMLLFQYVSSNAVDDAEVHLLRRVIFAYDNEGNIQLVQSNDFGFNGWSGLPIISASDYMPIGVYGKMDNIGGKQLGDNFIPHNKLVHAAGSLIRDARIDWAAKAREFIDDPRTHTLVAPTASGKSTAFPYEIAKYLVSRRRRGIVLVCNPLRAVPIALTAFMEFRIRQDGNWGNIEVHYSIGKDSSISQTQLSNLATKKVIIMYMSYGKQWAVNDLTGVKAVLLDEIHVRQSPVILMDQFLQAEQATNPRTVVRLTATSGEITADRPIKDIPHSAPSDEEIRKRKLVQVNDDFYFDPVHLGYGRKHMIFCTSKRQCDQVVEKIKKITPKVYSFYRGHPSGSTNIDLFNRSENAVIAVTNAAENGITLVGVTDVWDCRKEYVEVMQTDYSVTLEERSIDKTSALQRRGRAGRTTQMANYHYPASLNMLVQRHEISELIKIEVATMVLDKKKDDYLWLSDEFKAMVEKLKRMTEDMQLPNNFWRNFVRADLNVITFLKMIKITDGQLMPTMPFLLKVFETAIASGEIKEVQLKRDFKPVDVKDGAITEPTGVTWYHLDRGEDSEFNNANILLGLGGGVAALAIVSEISAQFVGIARATAVWIAPSKRWNDFLYATQLDFVLDYPLDRYVNDRAPSADPKLHNDNRMLTQLMGKTLNNTIVPHLVSAVITEKQYVVSKVYFDSAGKLHSDIIDETSDVLKFNLKTNVEKIMQTDFRELKKDADPKIKRLNEDHDCDLSVLEVSPLESKAMTLDRFDSIYTNVEVCNMKALNFNQQKALKAMCSDNLVRDEAFNPPCGSDGNTIEQQPWMRPFAAESEDEEENSYQAQVLASFQQTLNQLCRSYPQIIPAVAYVSQTGTLVVGGFSICWDALVKHFGKTGAMAIGLLTIASFTNPAMAISNTLTSVVLYAIKTMVMGNGRNLMGSIQKASPVHLGVTVFAGTMLSGLTFDMLKFQPQTGNMFGSSLTRDHGSIVIIAIKSLYRTFNLVMKGWQRPEQIDFGAVISQLGNWMILISNMSIYQTTITVATAAVLMSVRTLIRKGKSDQVKKYIETLKLKDAFDYVSKTFDEDTTDEAIMAILSIVSIVVSPTSSISVGILAAYGLFARIIEGKVVDSHAAKDIFTEALFDGAGLPLWLAFSQVIVNSAKLVMTQTTAPDVERNSFTTIAGIFSAISTALGLYKIKDELKHCEQNSVIEQLWSGVKNLGIRLLGFVYAAYEWIRTWIMRGIEYWRGEKIPEDDGSASMFDIDSVPTPDDTTYKYTQFLTGGKADARLSDCIAAAMQQTTGDVHLNTLALFSDVPESMIERTLVMTFRLDDVKYLDLTNISVTGREMKKLKLQGASGRGDEDNITFSTFCTADGIFVIVNLGMMCRVRGVFVLHIVGGLATVYMINNFSKDSAVSTVWHQKGQYFIESSKELLHQVTGAKVTPLAYGRDGRALYRNGIFKQLYEMIRKIKVEKRVRKVPDLDMIMSFMGGLKAAFECFKGFKLFDAAEWQTINIDGYKDFRSGFLQSWQLPNESTEWFHDMLLDPATMGFERANQLAPGFKKAKEGETDDLVKAIVDSYVHPNRYEERGLNIEALFAENPSAREDILKDLKKDELPSLLVKKIDQIQDQFKVMHLSDSSSSSESELNSYYSGVEYNSSRPFWARLLIPKTKKEKYKPYSREKSIALQMKLPETLVDKDLIERQIMQFKIPLDHHNYINDVGEDNDTPPAIVKQITKMLKPGGEKLVEFYQKPNKFGRLVAHFSNNQLTTYSPQNENNNEEFYTTHVKNVNSNSVNRIELSDCTVLFNSVPIEDKILVIQHLDYLLTNQPKVVFLVARTTNRKEIARVITNYSVNYYQFAFPMCADGALLRYIPVDLIILRKTVERNSYQQPVSDGYIASIKNIFSRQTKTQTLEEVFEEMTPEAPCNIIKYTDFANSVYHSYSLVDPVIVQLQEAIIPRSATELLDYNLNKLRLEMDNIRTLAKSTSRLRSGRNMPNELGHEYCQMADADKSFNVINNYKLEEGQIHFKNSAENRDIYLVNLRQGEVTYVCAHAVKSRIILVDSDSPKESHPTNQLSRSDTVGNNAIVIYRPGKKHYNIPRDFTNLIVITDLKDDNSLLIIAKLGKVKAHFSCLTDNGDLLLFVHSTTAAIEKLNFSYSNFLYRAALNELHEMRNNVYVERPSRVFSYPEIEATVNDWARMVQKLDPADEKRIQENFKWVLKPLYTVSIDPDYPIVEREIRNRLDRLEAVCNKYGVKLRPAVHCSYLKEVPILGTFKKSDRLQKDSCIVSAATYDIVHNLYNWDPTNSVVVQVSKQRDQFLESLIQRVDRPIFRHDEKVVSELREVMREIRIPPKHKFRFLTWEETKRVINKKGAAGMLDEWPNMRAFIEDPRSEDIFNNILEKLRKGENVSEDYNTIHNKVESKVNDVPIGEEQHRRPRVINYKGCAMRAVEWAMYGQFMEHHFKKGKLFKHTTGGTPISEMGDLFKRTWEKHGGDGNCRAAMGDASKWDHSLWTMLQLLKFEFVASDYEPEYQDAIFNNAEHDIWPVIFSRLGLIYSSPGHTSSGSILTSMNSLMNVVLTVWSWKKTLKIPMDEPLEKYITLYIDGDDNVHFGPAKYVNEQNMSLVNYYMKSVNITIRSKTQEGYRITGDLTDVDYLSHYYRPVFIACSSDDPDAYAPRESMQSGVFSKYHKEKWLPVRPIAEILGKMVYTMKQSTSRDTIKMRHQLEMGVELSDINKEAILIEGSKMVSYLLQYPHLVSVRSIGITLLSQLGFSGVIKETGSYWRDNLMQKVKEEMELPDTPVTLTGALKSLYGPYVNTFDDISLVSQEWEVVSTMVHFNRVVEASKLDNRKIPNYVIESAKDISACRKYISPASMSKKCISWALYQSQRNGRPTVLFPYFYKLWAPMLRHYMRTLNKEERESFMLENPEMNYDLQKKAEDLMDKFTTGIGGKIKDMLRWLNEKVLGEVVTDTLEIKDHKHSCVKCGKNYIHTHNAKGADHPQFPYQCPHEDCEWYYSRGGSIQKTNPTKSKKIPGQSLIQIAQNKRAPREQKHIKKIKDRVDSEDKVELNNFHAWSFVGGFVSCYATLVVIAMGIAYKKAAAAPYYKEATETLSVVANKVYDEFKDWKDKLIDERRVKQITELNSTKQKRPAPFSGLTKEDKRLIGECVMQTFIPKVFCVGFATRFIGEKIVTAASKAVKA